jgi:hypothetical protein
VLNFLLSLSANAKEKLAKAPLPANPNKSVMYADYVLNEEDVSDNHFLPTLKRTDLSPFLVRGLALS